MRKYLIAIALIAVAAGVWLNGQKLQKLVDGQAAPVTAQDPTNAELEQFAQIILGNGPVVPQPTGDDGGIALESTREVLTIGTPNAGRGDTLYDAANKIQNNFYELFNSVYTNAPTSLTYTNMIVSDGTDSVTAAEIIDSTDDAVALRTLSGTSTGATSLGTFTGDIVTDSSTVKTAIQELETDLDAIQTLSGVADAATNLGTFTGDIIADSSTIKSGMQQLETDIDAIQTLSGVADAATNLGTFTGNIITDGSATVKSAIQELETDLDAVQTLSGVADAATNLGAFTGDIITDNQTVKAAFQEVETDLDAIQTLSGVADAATSLGTFTGDIIPDSSTIKSGMQSLETYVEANAGGAAPFYILFMGQSNALGRGTGGGDLETNENVRIWNSTSGSFEVWDLTEDPPQYGDAATVGANNFTFHFSKKFNEVYGRPVYVIDSAKGGQSISSWVPSSSSLYTNMTAKVSAAGSPDIDLVLWHQGEANYLDSESSYKSSFDSLLTQLRAESFIADDTPVIAGQLGNEPNSAGINSSALNSFFDRENFSEYYEKDYVYLAETAYLELTDTIHFSGSSLVDMGRFYYWEAFQRALGGKIPRERIETDNSVDLNGSTQWVTLPDIGYSGTELSAIITCEATSETAVSVLFGFDTGTSSSGERFVGYISDYAVRFLYTAGATSNNYVSGSVYLEPGSDVIIGYSVKSGEQRIYVNGRLVDIASYDIPEAIDPAAYKVGAYKDNDSPHNGKVYSFVFYDRFLSDVEHYDYATSGVVADGPVVNLSNKGINSQKWADESGNLYHGSYVGTPTIATSSTITKIGNLWLRDNSGTLELSDDGGVSWATVDITP
jgi:hypothetical protein